MILSRSNLQIRPKSNINIRKMTTNFLFNHTMLRIKDPEITIPFYEKHFGMKVIEEMVVNKFNFTNYFLALDSSKSLNHGRPFYEREGVLELCHNHGTEKDASYTLNNGNKDPYRGFGHICFTVDNVVKFCEQLEQANVKFQKRLSDGRMHNLAFALDPNGYWIELLENPKTKTNDASLDINTMRLNHTMYRVKDAQKSLEFYRTVLGMKLLREGPQPAAKFTNYFLGYADSSFEEGTAGPEMLDLQGVLELCHNWGTEHDSEFSYHTGNADPQGYGHIGIVVDDVDKAIEHAEVNGAKITKRKLDGGLKFVGFIVDPDGYSIEFLPRARLPSNL